MNGILNSVLNMSITGSLIIAALMLLRLPMKKAPKKYSYILWAIPGIRLLCPFSLSSAMSVFNLFRPEVDSHRMEYIPPETATVFSAPQTQLQPGINIQGMLPPQAEVPAPEVNIALILTWIWVIGALGILIFNAIRYAEVAVRVRRSENMGGYYVCKSISTPFVFGVFRPRIYLPEGLSESDVSCILAHERAHIRRKDHIVKLLCVAVLSVHWFNPLAWLGVKLMTSDMELSCDEMALNEISHEHRKEYARALLNISMMQNGLAFSGMLGFGEANIRTRIKEVLNIKKPTVAVSAAAVAVIAVAALCLLTNATGNKTDEKLPKEFDGYINAMEADIPYLSFDGAVNQAEFRSQTAEKILFQKAELESCTAYLLGEGVYRDKNDPNDIFAVKLKLGISTDGKTVGAVYDAPAEFAGVSQVHYRIENYGAGYLFAYDLDIPIVELCCHGEESSLGAFYAIIDGEPRLLMGDMSEIGGDANGQDIGVCFTRTLLAEGGEPNTLLFSVLNSHGVIYRFNTENILADEYKGPQFTAELIGQLPEKAEPEETADTDVESLSADGLGRVDEVVTAFVKFSEILGQYGNAETSEAYEQNGETYYPVAVEGYESYQAVKDLLNSAFTDDLAENLINTTGIIDVNGRAYAAKSMLLLSEQYTLSCVSGERMAMAEIWQEDLNDRGQYRVTQLTLSPALDYRAAYISTHFTSDLKTMPFVPITENTGFDFPEGRNDFELAEAALRFFCHDNLFSERINPIAAADTCLKDGRVVISVKSTTGGSAAWYATYMADRKTGDATDEFGRKINIFADEDAPESGVSAGAFESMIVSKINDLIFYEKAFGYGSLNYLSEGVTPVYRDGQYLYPVTEKGFTEYDDVIGFLRGLFTDSLAEKNISTMRYKNVDGKTYTYDNSGYGWSVSDKYSGYAVAQEDGYTVVEFKRQLLSQGDEDEYMYTLMKLEADLNDLKIASYEYHYSNDRFDDYKPLSAEPLPDNSDIEKLYDENEEYIQKEILSAIIFGRRDYSVSNLRLEKREVSDNRLLIWARYDAEDLRELEKRPYCAGILLAVNEYSDPEQAEYAQAAAERLIEAEKNEPHAREQVAALIIAPAENAYGYEILNCSSLNGFSGETSPLDSSAFVEDTVGDITLGEEVLQAEVFSHFYPDSENAGILYDRVYSHPLDPEGSCAALIVFHKTGRCTIEGLRYVSADGREGSLDFTVDGKTVTVYFGGGRTVSFRVSGENTIEVTEAEEQLERDVDGTVYTINAGDVFTAS